LAFTPCSSRRKSPTLPWLDRGLDDRDL
jgi:hypothetical protein